MILLSYPAVAIRSPCAAIPAIGPSCRMCFSAPAPVAGLGREVEQRARSRSVAGAATAGGRRLRGIRHSARPAAMMAVVAATAGLQRLRRLLGAGKVAVLQRLSDFGQGAIWGGAIVADQGRIRLLCATDVARLYVG